MSRFLVAAVLAVCVNYAASQTSQTSWTEWSVRDRCACAGGADGFETWQRECFSGCTKSYEESRRPCQCGGDLVLTPGEIAGIAVGSVVFLILIIILFVWCCCCCGQDCGCDDDGYSGGGCMGCGGGCMGCGGGCMGCGGGCNDCGRYDDEEDVYRGRGQVRKAPPMMTQVQAPMQTHMQPQPQQIILTAAPQMQVRQPAQQYTPVNFGGAVVQQQMVPQASSTTYFVGTR